MLRPFIYIRSLFYTVLPTGVSLLQLTRSSKCQPENSHFSSVLCFCVVFNLKNNNNTPPLPLCDKNSFRTLGRIFPPILRCSRGPGKRPIREQGCSLEQPIMVAVPARKIRPPSLSFTLFPVATDWTRQGRVLSLGSIPPPRHAEGDQV